VAAKKDEVTGLGNLLLDQHRWASAAEVLGVLNYETSSSD